MKLSFLYDETSIIPNFATNSDAMKVTLDLDQLKNEGRITAEEYNRLRKFAAEATVSLAGGLSVRSGSMAALSSFMFLGALGEMTGYMHRFGGESAMVFVVTWRSFSFSWLRGPPLPTGVGSSRQERCSLSSTFTRSGLSVCH